MKPQGPEGRIFDLLQEKGRKFSAPQLAKALDIKGTKIYYLLDKLLTAGYVIVTKEFGKRWYSVNQQKPEEPNQMDPKLLVEKIKEHWETIKQLKETIKKKDIEIKASQSQVIIKPSAEGSTILVDPRLREQEATIKNLQKDLVIAEGLMETQKTEIAAGLRLTEVNTELRSDIEDLEAKLEGAMEGKPSTASDAKTRELNFVIKEQAQTIRDQIETIKDQRDTFVNSGPTEEKLSELDWLRKVVELFAEASGNVIIPMPAKPETPK